MDVGRKFMKQNLTHGRTLTDSEDNPESLKSRRKAFPLVPFLKKQILDVQKKNSFTFERLLMMTFDFFF